MGKIKVVLWDIDRTLLMPDKPEAVAVRKGFNHFGLGECSDAMVARYTQINKIWWKKLDDKLISKSEALDGRFSDFLAQYGLDSKLGPAFNEYYQDVLGEVVDPIPGGLETMKKIYGRVIQGIVTNGTVKTQAAKIRTSGIDHFVEKIFISDEIGYEKPSTKFFDYVAESLASFKRDEMMVVGDSFSNDILGALNSGFVACWYNPNHSSYDPEIKIDFVIDDLAKVEDIVNL